MGNAILCLLFCAATFLTPLHGKGNQEYTSPRITALQEELAAGNSLALEKFWEEVAKKGTPLIEFSSDSDSHRLVTFLWRGKKGIRWVQLISELTQSAQDQRTLIQLRNTDVWYRTFRLRNDARFAYGFADGTGGEIARRAIPSQPNPDPLNPRRALTGGPLPSLCELPKAPPQPWINRQPGVAGGRVEWKNLKSKRLKNERAIGIYTPAGYQISGQLHALLLVFDGEIYTTTVPTPVILDNLLAHEMLPPFVAVFVPNMNPSKRAEELSCNVDFTDFLAKELIPWVRQSYRVTTDPKQTIIAGSSLGGLAASFAAFRYPMIFGNVLSQSGAYARKLKNRGGPQESEWLTRQFAARPKLPVRFYIDAGLLETGLSPIRGNVSLLAANRHLRDVLLAKGYAIHYREFNGGHDYINWRGTFADGLLLLSGKDGNEKKDK